MKSDTGQLNILIGILLGVLIVYDAVFFYNKCYGAAFWLCVIVIMALGKLREGA